MRRLFLTLSLSAAILFGGALVPAPTAGPHLGQPVPADCCSRA